MRSTTLLAIIGVVLMLALVYWSKSAIERRCLELGGNPGECHAIAWSGR